jgi:hypothetical protein
MLFRIPRISKLLIFKDVLSHPDALVSVVGEVLKLGDPDVLYLGYDPVHSPRKDVLAKSHDSAIIRICLPGKEIVRKDKAKAVKLVIDELQKPRNLISIASETLSIYENIIAVAISVESSRHYNKCHVDCMPLPHSS